MLVASQKLLTVFLSGVAPWRDSDNMGRHMHPLKQGQDRDNLRWPLFNQRSLTEPSGTFLLLLEKRANDHPREFARLDDFWDNRMLAVEEGFSIGEEPWASGSNLVVMETATDRGDYGAMQTPVDKDNFDELRVMGLWFERRSIQVMFIQRRIYRFLAEMVSRIVKLPLGYTVPGEEQEPAWKPQRPEDQPDSEEYEANLDRYVGFYRDAMHYTPLSEDLVGVAVAICNSRVNFYEGQLQALKTSPGFFYHYLFDVREHSHHQFDLVSGGKHAWVSHFRLQNLFCATPERGIGGELSLTGA